MLAADAISSIVTKSPATLQEYLINHTHTLRNASLISYPNNRNNFLLLDFLGSFVASSSLITVSFVFVVAKEAGSLGRSWITL